MDELKRKHQIKNDPRTQTFPIIGSCAFLAFHLLSLFFGAEGIHVGPVSNFPKCKYEQDYETTENNLDGKHCQFLSSANLSNWYITAVSSLVNNNLSRCS